MLLYLYFIISLSMAIASVVMLSHKNKVTIRAFGLVLAYIAAGIALKVFFMINPQ